MPAGKVTQAPNGGAQNSIRIARAANASFHSSRIGPAKRIRLRGF
jgi:hypothetical protein